MELKEKLIKLLSLIRQMEAVGKEKRGMRSRTQHAGNLTEVTAVSVQTVGLSKCLMFCCIFSLLYLFQQITIMDKVIG